jgi:TRAP-type uncharacterized transport system substrate-binding protein
MKLKYVIALSVALWAIGGESAVADDLKAAPPCQLSLATGKPDKGFSKLFRDIQAVCGEEVQICEVHSEGGLQNATLLAANQADLGFVQIDTLQSLKQSDENIAALLAVMPANANLLHIVVRTDGFSIEGERKLGFLWRQAPAVRLIAKFSDLKGLPVALVGSAQLVGRLLEKRFAHGMRFIDVDTDEQALDKLRTGEVAAMFSMSGWPSGTLGELKRESRFTLVPFDLSPEPPQRLIRKNYPNLGVFNNVFLAAPNLLVSRPFKADGTKGGQVARLKACILRNLDTLQEGSFDPAWKELTNPNESYGWHPFLAAPDASPVRAARAAE